MIVFKVSGFGCGEGMRVGKLDIGAKAGITNGGGFE